MIESNKSESDVGDLGDNDINILENNQFNNTNDAQEQGYFYNISSPETIARVSEKEKEFERAKELIDPDGYINVDNITIAENIGKKVILVDFWTYSCINCQRTLPYLRELNDKYSDKGLLIVGVHTPEFNFEKEYDNVARAVEKFGVNWPVVQDNDKKTFRSYNNKYWPRKYLIDIDGFIVYDHIGEGAYRETEIEVRKLLEERNEVLGIDEKIGTDNIDISAQAPDFTKIGTKELYFGSNFAKENQFGNPEGRMPGENVDYSLPDESEIEENKFYLEGTWYNGIDGMKLISNRGKIVLIYNAKNVNLVAGSSIAVNADIMKDGKLERSIAINHPSLYNLIEGEEYGTHKVEIEFKSPGVEVNTFTFG
ncbi:redoxin family protein [Candidatus Woesearchaeota archaeon]|nr:redoxin family protein [Candidatus Woesearchaeota archaeon]